MDMGFVAVGVRAHGGDVRRAVRRFLEREGAVRRGGRDGAGAFRAHGMVPGPVEPLSGGFGGNGAGGDRAAQFRSVSQIPVDDAGRADRRAAGPVRPRAEGFPEGESGGFVVRAAAGAGDVHVRYPLQ